MKELNRDVVDPSENAGEKHAEHQARGVCKYCKRQLYHDFRMLKNEQYCCSDRDGCLRYIEQSPDKLADTVRKKFYEFSLRPNSPVIFELVALLQEVDDPKVTDMIMEVFHFETENRGVFGLALHCLGLIRDPRAIKYLIERYDILSNDKTKDLSPEMQVITEDHLQRAAISIIHLIATGRSMNPEAIPYVTEIVRSSILPESMKIVATEALKILANTHPILYEECLKNFLNHQA